MACRRLCSRKTSEMAAIGGLAPVGRAVTCSPLMKAPLPRWATH
jgi:hypothetical protein